MRMNDVFPSTYLKADDIPKGSVVSARIDRVEKEELGQGKDKETKPVMYFIGKEKGLVMNKTNWQMVAYAYGDESDDWHGQGVQIVRDMTTFGGKPVECLRLRIPQPMNGGGQAQARPAEAALTTRREEIRNRAPAESPVSEESQFDESEIPF